MNLNSENHTFGLVISVAERRIDAPVAIRFKDEMRQATEGVEGRIILDLSHVDFVDSSGLAPSLRPSSNWRRGRSWSWPRCR